MVSDSLEARYDGHADHYDRAFPRYAAPGDSPGADLATLLGPPVDDGLVVDVCCGTGLSGASLVAAGWRVGGADLSTDQLGLAQPRLAWTVRADAHRLPFASSSLGHVVMAFAHTDVERFDEVIAEVGRVLRPGGRFVYVGVHPCFVGPHIDPVTLSDGSLSLTEGYRPARWSPPEEFDTPRYSVSGIRRRVGAHHLPLADLLGSVIGAGLAIDTVVERGDGLVPWRLGLAAVTPSADPGPTGEARVAGSPRVDPRHSRRT